MTAPSATTPVVVIEGGTTTQVVEVSAPGTAGPPGPPGPPGPSNAAHVGAWNWSTQTAAPTSSEVVEPPSSSGQLRSASGDWRNATTLYLSDTTVDGVDVSTWLSPILADGTELRVQQKTDANRWASFDISGPWTQSAGYFEISVVWLEGGTSLPSNNAELRCALIESGSARLDALEARIAALEARIGTV